MKKAQNKNSLAGGVPEILRGTATKYRNWYEYITPLLGVKWAAEVTLVGYTWIARADSDGLRLACVIVAGFLFLEWAQLAWCDFKRRAQ